MSDLPNTDVVDWLTQQGVRRVFHAPLGATWDDDPGNNGDHLIRLGAEEAFRKAGVESVASPENAELILLRGNGAMLEKFRAGKETLSRYSNEFPDTPLAVLPASYLFPTESIADRLANRRAPTTLFCRETYSYKHLTEDHDLPAGCSVLLSEDTAFYLAGSPLVESLSGHPGEHVLLVERVDSEHPAMALSASKRSLTSKIGGLLPLGVKQMLYPLVDRGRGLRQTPFRKRAEAILASEHPELVGQPRVVADISLKRSRDFDGFCQDIAKASAVFSTRLHVAILAALCGKPTYIFTGAYHKIQGIYEQSMTHFDRVQLVSDWAGEEAGS